MRITLCEIWAEGGATHAKERELDLEDGVIAEEALAQAGRKLASGEGLCVFGRRADVMTVLHDGDRLEISAPLLVDPKEARRRRAERQGDVRVVTAGRHGGKHRLDKEE